MQVGVLVSRISSALARSASLSDCACQERPRAADSVFVHTRLTPTSASAGGGVRIVPSRTIAILAVEVSLTLGVDRGALVVPSASVQPGQKGTIAWVVRGDGTVEARPVLVSRSTDRWAVVSSGLKAGESVVTDGQIRLSPGARVEASVDEAYRGGLAAASDGARP